MKTSRYIPLLLLALCLPSLLSAQSSSVRKETRRGNREYKSQHYDRAEVNYRRALHEDSTAYRAQYNLGNTLYRQKKYDEAIQHYDQALTQPGLKDKERSQILHNRGNSYLKAGLDKENRAEGMQQFQQAVNDYQEALKLSPKNDDTRSPKRCSSKHSNSNNSSKAATRIRTTRTRKTTKTSKATTVRTSSNSSKTKTTRNINNSNRTNRTSKTVNSRSNSNANNSKRNKMPSDCSKP